MIKLTAQFLVGYAVTLTVAFYFIFGAQVALSCLSGSLIMLLNLVGFYLSWRLIFAKRSTALTVLAIVCKYTILILIFWSLTKMSWLAPVAFIAGISTFILAILSMTVTKSFARKL